jgi:cytochrome c553
MTATASDKEVTTTGSIAPRASVRRLGDVRLSPTPFHCWKEMPHMRSSLRLIPLLAAVALLALWAAPANAFHDQGVAACNGCHTMHNSQNGVLMGDNPSGPGQGNYWLLLDSTPTDTCLRCHGAASRGYQVWGTSTATPLGGGATHGGGDFVFLTEDNLNDGHRGATTPRPGYYGGHNVVSVDKAVTADPVLATAPGGSFPSEVLACSSCHDPHGTDAFRLLYGANRIVRGRRGDGTVFTTTFVNPSPSATGIALSASTWEGETNHTAYAAGMSAWCANCHGNFHEVGMSNLIHPSGTPLGATIAAIYNAYDGTTDCVANPPAGGLPCGTGTQATAYLAQVPFEDAANGDVTSTAGPTGTSTVMCLSCHRAHASSAMDAGRWDFQVALLAEDGHESGSLALNNPYDANQRSLCNKCHAKDEFDHLPTP